MASNSFPGYCADGCGTWVAAGAGYFQAAPKPGKREPPQKHKWIVRCMACVVARHEARGEELSDRQRQWKQTHG